MVASGFAHPSDRTFGPILHGRVAINYTLTLLWDAVASVRPVRPRRVLSMAPYTIRSIARIEWWVQMPHQCFTQVPFSAVDNFVRFPRRLWMDSINVANAALPHLTFGRHISIHFVNFLFGFGHDRLRHFLW